MQCMAQSARALSARALSARALSARAPQKTRALKLTRPSPPPNEDTNFYVLYGQHSRNVAGFIGKDSLAYVVAFKEKRVAEQVRSFAHEATAMWLDNFTIVDITENVEQAMNLDAGTFAKANIPPIYADDSAHLHVSKAQNINKMGCYVQAMDRMDFYALPFERNIGVVLGKRLLEDTPYEVVFEAEVIDPLRDTDLMRQMLLERQDM